MVKDDNKEIIKKFLENEDDVKNIILHIEKLIDSQILILDVGYKTLSIGVNHNNLEQYLKRNNIIEIKIKYVASILLKLLKNYIQKKELCLSDENSVDNNILIKLLKEEIIDEELINKVLFEFNCLSDKLDIYSDQIINKEINSHKIKSAFIKCTTKKSLSNECNEFAFEIDKTSLGELIESLQELYEQL